MKIILLFMMICFSISSNASFIRSAQIKDGGVHRPDLNTTETGNAVITKVIAGQDITITSTGVDAGTGDVTVNKVRQKIYTQVSGKFDLFTTSAWVSWSDPVFGINQADWDNQHGTAAEPTVDWDGLGMLFPIGATLKKAFFKCRGNNDDIDSIQTFARVHDVSIVTQLPIDSAAEIGPVTVSPVNTIDLDAGLADGNDVRGWEVNLNDYTFVNVGDLHIMTRGTAGSLTANRQLRCTTIVEWEEPLL